MDDAKKDLKQKKRIFIAAVLIALYLAVTDFSFWTSTPLIIALVAMIGYLNKDEIRRRCNSNEPSDYEHDGNMSGYGSSSYYDYDNDDDDDDDDD